MRSIIIAAIAGCAACASAQLDNNVQWSGVSHEVAHDLSPRVPRNGESFHVRFQTYRDDVSSARLRVDTGAIASIDGTLVGSRGPYDLWEAIIPATASSALGYTIEVRDGTDVDYLGASGMSDELAGASPFQIDYATLSHAPAGSTPVVGGAVFKVWSPTRTSCVVRGQFNNWGTSAPLTRVGEYFVGFVPNAQPGQMYKYYFNNSVWASDPRSAALVPTDNHNSVLTNQDAYIWTDNTFSPRPMEELVIYQLHVGTFAGRNDPMGSTPNPSRYVDVAARAGHLAELGVNAVMLNPINEFPGDFSGGYNSIGAFAIESKLGTPDEFKQMIDALHQHGIAVLLDVVWNHVSSADNILWNHDGTQIYFDSPHIDTPWGAQADFDRAGVFDYYLDAAETLLTEYRLDGFRVDATMYMTDSFFTPQWSSGQAFVRAMHDRMANRHADKHTIAEIYIDNRWVTDPTSTGLGFTAQYQNEFKEAVRSAVFGAASGSPNMQRVANVLDGQGFGVSGQSVFNYFELHDDAWPLNGHERAVREIDTTPPSDDDFARGRTIVGNTLTPLSRGVPGILQGTEWLEDDGWESSKIDWSHKATYRGIFDYYHDLIALRTTQPALYANSPLWAYHVNESLDVLAFERYQDGGGSFVAVVNLSNSDRNGYRIGIPRDGQWELIINSNDPKYDGPGRGTPAGPVTIEDVASGPHPRSVVLDIPARSVLLLQHEPGGACAGDWDASGGQPDSSDFLAYLNDWSAQAPGADLAPPGGDGAWDSSDFLAYLNLFVQGC
ncbi:MAG: alpha-amylase family glycosyl hydrolase [Phycisphaerales bacterium]|jgi:1,4-alpha-glucan branching enzyme|nr:alpha-amylase family glycosyl hydrolase [Phycisphaerales bacterium]